MNNRTLKIWLGTTLLLTLIAVPFLAQGDQSDQQRKLRNAQLIANLSDSQRARLLQSESMYRAASPETKLAMHSLHDNLQKELRSGRNELNSVMEKYHAWLRTLEPFERAQLDETRDSGDRIKLMQQILRHQRERAAQQQLAMQGPWRPFFPVLDEKSYRSVMNGLEQVASKRLSDSAKDELSQLSGLRRDYKLIRLLQDSGAGGNPKPLVFDPPEEFKIVARDIDQYVDDPRIRDFVHGVAGGMEDRPDLPPPPPPGDALARLVLHSMWSERNRQMNASRKQVDRDKLEAFLETLSREKQHELLSLKAGEFQNELKNLYLDSLGVNGLPTFEELRELSGRRGVLGGGPDRGPPAFGFGPPPRDGRGRRGMGLDRRQEDRDGDRTNPGPDRGPDSREENAESK